MKQVLMIVILSMVMVIPVGAQEEAVAQAVLFWMEDCPHCRQVMDDVMPALADRFGSQLDIQLVEVETADEVDRLFETARDLGLTPNEIDVPLVVMGDQVLVGDEITDRLPEMVEQALAAGGVDWPDLPGWSIRPTPEPEPAEDLPTVSFWLFWDSHCGDCLVLMEEILPPILESYPKGQVIVHVRDLEKGNFEMLMAFEQHHGIEMGPIPQIYIGDQALLGNEEIQARLPALIGRYLAQGGIKVPPVPVLPTPTRSVTSGGPAVHLAYFGSLDCQTCDLIVLALDDLRSRYPQLVVHEYTVVGDAALLARLCSAGGIKVSQCIAPAAFVGQRGLAGEELVPSALTTLITDHLAEGAAADWQGSNGADGLGRGLLDGRYVGWVVGAVVLLLGAGLWWSAKQGRGEQHDE